MVKSERKRNMRRLALFVFFLTQVSPISAASYTCSANGQELSAVDPSFFNLYVGVGTIPGYRTGDYDQALPLFRQIQSSGVRGVRMDLSWNTVENTRGIYDWSKHDAIFRAAADAGLSAVLTLVSVPVWARTQPDKIILDPAYNADWANFVQAAIHRYSLYSGTVAPIAYAWQIWNEPYGNTMFNGTPGEMVTLLNFTYDILKEYDPQSQVYSPSVAGAGVLSNIFLGTTYQVSTEFFTQTIANGKFDVLDIHLYTDTATAVSLVQSTKEYLQSHGNVLTKNAQLAVTETNLNYITGNHCEVVNSLTEAQMAAMVVDRYVCLSQAGVDYAYYFMALDLNRTCANGDTSVRLGILNEDLSPRPVHTAMWQTISDLTLKPGDANGDNRVDGVDYVIWLNHYNQNVTGASNGDFNNSGRVDGVDYVVWLNNYGR